jgi:hypothetical protein
VYNDMSTDASMELLKELQPAVDAVPRVHLLVSGGPPGSRPRGPGYARNRAIAQVLAWLPRTRSPAIPTPAPTAAM